MENAVENPAMASKTSGRLSTDVSIREMRLIYRARKQGLSFDGIERDPKFDLRQANGMTAYRIVEMWRKLKGIRKIKMRAKK